MDLKKESVQADTNQPQEKSGRLLKSKQQKKDEWHWLANTWATVLEQSEKILQLLRVE